MTAATIIELPAGVHHISTFTYADSWEVYDALTEQDGWAEEAGEPYKHGSLGGYYIFVHPPLGPRDLEGGDAA
jgi:hypothetical protein